MLLTKKITAIIIIIFSFFWVNFAEAKSTGLSGFDNQMFRPQFDGFGLYNVAGSKVLPHLKYSFGLYTNFSHGLASVVMPARGTSLEIIKNNLTADIGSALGLFDFMEIGLDIPVTFYQSGYDYNDLQKYNTAALGDIRFDTKFRLLSDKSWYPGISLLSVATFPTGDRRAFTGYKNLTWEGRLIVSKEFKPVSLYSNVGYRIAEKVRVLSTDFDGALTFGGGVKFPIPAGDRSWSLLAEGYGEMVTNNAGEISSPVEIRGGVRKDFKSGIALDLGGGGGVTNAYGSPDFRVFAGVSFNSARHKVPPKKPDIEKETLLFSFDSAVIKKDQHPQLVMIAQKLAENQNMKVQINGYADSIGGSSYNMQLSKRRAEGIKGLLISFGVSPDQIEINCFGEDRPAATNVTPEGRRLNRRAEILFLLRPVKETS